MNAGPDIRLQIEAFPPLQPDAGTRRTPIEGVLLTDAELDHTLGLLSLREAESLRVSSTRWVYHALTNWNPLLHTLRCYCQVIWSPVDFAESFLLHSSRGDDSSLSCRAFTSGSTKTVAFAPQGSPHPEASIGYLITDERTGGSFAYLPSVQELTVEIVAMLAGCKLVLIDGTCWSDEELAGVSKTTKTSRGMGHVPISGPNGSLEQLARLDIERCIYTHLNNTNPVLVEGSPQRRAVEGKRIEVASDGIEMEL